MAVYKNDTLVEQSIYGSSRLGLMTATSKTGYRTLGGKKYELSNHLGNVLAVVSDNIHLDQDSTWASVVNVTDYYPFGLAMDGRSEQDSSYRYGFNGKERDDNGEFGSTVYDYGFRIYNPAIGRFLSVDPLFQSYPWYTPYQFAGNNPIWAVDRDGLEEEKVNPGQKRADAGKEVIKNYQETGTTYSQPKRVIGLNATCADCSSTTKTILKQAGQDDLFKTNWTGKGLGTTPQPAADGGTWIPDGGIQYEIQKMAGSDNLKDPYRKTDPKVGDIMMWNGHIAVVTDVTDSKVKWANMGVSSKAGIRSASTASAEKIEQGAEVYSSDFWGFWTPPNAKGDGTQPAVTKSTSGDVAQQTVQQQEVNMANTANTSSASPTNQGSSSSGSSWWSGVKNDWDQFWSDLHREASNPYNWTGR